MIRDSHLNTPLCVGAFVSLLCPVLDAVGGNELLSITVSKTPIQMLDGKASVFAVGTTDCPPTSCETAPYSIAWNGVTFDELSIPLPTGWSTSQIMGGALKSNAAIGGELMAAGGIQPWYPALPPIGPLTSFTTRWTGGKWKDVDAPWVTVADGTTDVNDLYGISGSAPTNIWAVGVAGSTEHAEPIVIHWDGSAWSQSPHPANLGNLDNVLTSVVTISAHDAWAAGWYQVGAERVLIYHWDGTAWSVVNAQNPGQGQNAFNGIAGFGGKQCLGGWKHAGPSF